MEVFYEGTWGKARHLYPCTALPVKPQKCSWYGGEWFLPAVYGCGQGLVFDLFMAVPQASYRAYLEKWMSLPEEELEEREEEIERENPLTKPVHYTVTVNGRMPEGYSASSSVWIPGVSENEAVCGEESGIPALLEAYGLSESCPDRAWHHMRVQMPWATKRRPRSIRRMTLTLTPEERPISLPLSFEQPCAEPQSREIPFDLPGEGTARLCIEESRAELLPERAFQEDAPFCWPRAFSLLHYTVEPALPAGIRMQLRDASPGDPPKYIGKRAGYAPAMSSAIGVIVRGDREETVLSAASSAYFDCPETLQWKLCLYAKPAEDIEFALLSADDPC